MKITPDELSRRIAEFLEPETLPEFVSARNLENAKVFLDRKCFEPVCVGPEPFSGRYKYVPRPRNMIEDPEMTVMLLEKMEQVELHRGSDGWIIYPAVPVQYEDETLYRYGQILQKDLRLAVAQAFAFANGLVTKEELT